MTFKWECAVAPALPFSNFLSPDVALWTGFDAAAEENWSN